MHTLRIRVAAHFIQGTNLNLVSETEMILNRTIDNLLFYHVKFFSVSIKQNRFSPIKIIVSTPFRRYSRRQYNVKSQPPPPPQKITTVF